MKAEQQKMLDGEFIVVGPFRTARHRPGLFPSSLQLRTAGTGQQVARPALSGWAVAGLGKDEEPEASGDEPREDFQW